MADFGAKTKPLILDFTQRAVGIIWSKLKKIELVQLNYSHSHARSGRTGYKQTFRIEDANFDLQSFDPFGKIVIVKPQGKITPVVDPISDAMRKNLLVWTRGYKKTEDENGFHERNNVFFNLGLILPMIKTKTKIMRYKISFPAVGAATTEASPTLYYVWADFTPFPEPGSDLFAEEAPVFLDSIYTDPDEAAAQAALLSIHSRYVVYPYAQPPQIVNDVLDYKADIQLYTERKNFVFDADGVLANSGDKSKDSFVISRNGSSGPLPVPLPAERWEVTTNALGKTNTVTAAK